MPATAPLCLANWRQSSRKRLREPGVRAAGAVPARPTGPSVNPPIASGVGASARSLSVIADPRIEEGVGDVRQDVEDHDEQREDEADRLHHRNVGGVDRAYQ